jgi:hypothetical protein
MNHSDGLRAERRRIQAALRPLRRSGINSVDRAVRRLSRPETRKVQRTSSAS